MPATPRKEIIDESEVGTYHCIVRCVREAFLCGRDRQSGRDRSHRRAWIRDRVIELVSLMAVEVEFLAFMENHLHLILRNRPDAVSGWDDRQIMLRACKLFPWKFKQMEINNGQPTDQQLQALIGNQRLVKEMRSRLSSISWFMRQLCQHIARRANEEDQVSGHFWASRFRSIPLLDPVGLVLCAMYVDLNPIRANQAQTPETSAYTSARYRIHGWQARQQNDTAAPRYDGWLTPIHEEGDGQTNYPPAGTLQGMRASDRGTLDMTLPQYLELLDWSGRQLREDKPGHIPATAPNILDRLKLSAETWLTCLREFRTLFGVAVGTPESLARYAVAKKRNWLHKIRRVAAAFSPAEPASG